jgi:AbrB family looped-hinge helix DNA binding protein
VKATGIVRRIDDLGRIVIPKEIRRTLRIREGDPLLTTLTESAKADDKRDLFARAVSRLSDT